MNDFKRNSSILCLGLTAQNCDCFQIVNVLVFRLSKKRTPQGVHNKERHIPSHVKTCVEYMYSFGKSDPRTHLFCKRIQPRTLNVFQVYRRKKTCQDFGGKINQTRKNNFVFL
jgi:ribosomal protein L37E